MKLDDLVFHVGRETLSKTGLRSHGDGVTTLPVGVLAKGRFKLGFYYPMNQEMNEAFNGCAFFENSPLDSPSGVTPAIIEVEGLASWFDLCENEDAGKDEHSRWEMSSIEPNKTDGGVERDVFDSEEGLSQEQELFSEQGNSHVHLSLPDDTSVQSCRPEVENEESQDTSLFAAVINGHTDIVRLLIENGADVNKGVDTPLAEAARNGHTDIARLLIENGADVNKRLDTPLCEAAKDGHTDITRLLTENGADVNKEGWDTPLAEATRNGHTDIVRLLIENGADVNEGERGMSLLSAATNGHTDIVRLLVQNGAAVNKGRDTPLCEAAINGHTDISRLLIENGADVNEGGLGMSLFRAARNGHTDIVRLLIENGANVNKGGLGRGTPLSEAAKNGHIDIIRLLIENGAGVNEGERYFQFTKVPCERKYDVQLKGKKTASLPKMSGKKLITQTEMTCPRDIVEEGECGRDPMKDVESGLSSLHLSPGCEQFYPCIMDESPGDSRI